MQDPLTEAIANLLSALFSLLAIGWLFDLITLCLIVALITWIVKIVWYAGGNREWKQKQKRYKKQQKELQRYQKKCDKIKKKNASKRKTEHKYPEQKDNEQRQDKFANNPDWVWDEEHQI